MSNDLVVQLGAKLDQFASDMNQAGDLADSAVGREPLPAAPIFYVVRAKFPGLNQTHLAAFEDPEDAAAHVTWLVPRAIGDIRTFECSGD
jgi:hypothetical protein